MRPPPLAKQAAVHFIALAMETLSSPAPLRILQRAHRCMFISKALFEHHSPVLRIIVLIPSSGKCTFNTKCTKFTARFASDRQIVPFMEKFLVSRMYCGVETSAFGDEWYFPHLNPIQTQIRSFPDHFVWHHQSFQTPFNAFPQGHWIQLDPGNRLGQFTTANSADQPCVAQ